MRSDNDAIQVKKRYQGEAGKVYHQKHDVPNPAHKWIAQNRSEKLAGHVAPDDVVLEYGVGPGWNLENIACKQRLGYDLSLFLKDQLSAKSIDFITDTRALTDASIDTTICHHVLEHTPDPAQVLMEINRLLKNEGKLILIVPYEKERKYRIYDPIEPNHHLYSWNVQTLGNLVTDLGFKIKQAGLGRYGYDRALSVLALRLGMGAFGFRLMKKIALTIIPLLEVRIVAIKIKTA
ncbi:methyltransferase domain-containing protein [uncultured Desulfosarcina sp.]|uniref:class I SAM-dependent methyltransferase n=1 Tax=uncultured Desulfosarcina sp. TaxID=218289 RepID=UPI0029C7CDC8|nr:methyltransferase domain-containing protein [uncultured Desulfosarcina sp.]